MGTNFELRERINKEKKEKLKSLIDEENWEDLIDNIPENIHIGKRSTGWKFLWDAHDFRYFKPNKESLIEWLKSGDIYDEYGRKYSFEQFWNKEIWFDGFDCETYYQKEKCLYKGIYELRKQFLYKEMFNINVNEFGEFYIDNLCFTVNEDFA